MKRIALVLLWGLVAASSFAQEKPYRAAYYYKVRWGFQDEFKRLFFKNHLPVLMLDKEAGVVLGVDMYEPMFHGDGRADWTFLVVITYASRDALTAPRSPAVDEKVRKLYPDRETFEREERRRFEILDAHWDVPLNEIAPPKSPN